MSEKWWMPHERHYALIDRIDTELDAAEERAFAVEAGTWFSREAVNDCA